MHVKLAEKKDIKISLLGNVHLYVEPAGDIFPSWDQVPGWCYNYHMLKGKKKRQEVSSFYSCFNHII